MASVFVRNISFKVTEPQFQVGHIKESKIKIFVVFFHLFHSVQEHVKALDGLTKVDFKIEGGRPKGIA